ncbi:MAG: hypothetical protein EOO16_22325 [Chitinophagaceae bacterium]|nr:MAG: hypothetical protein EOO16_22325 [Chitinophagaceae bacterium]
MKATPLLAFYFILTACGGGDRAATPAASGPAPTVAPATIDPVPARLDSFRRLARPGDLVLRLGEDMVSYSIRYLSERDPSYSHVGLVLEKDGALQVAHIGPYAGGRDTLQSEPIDSFLSPAHNLAAGLYRFRISDAERARFLGNVAKYQQRRVHFDYAYDLATNDKLYCSELIAKSLSPATGNRLQFAAQPVPPSMKRLIGAYLAGTIGDSARIGTGRYIPLDELYRSTVCDSILKISLRSNP